MSVTDMVSCIFTLVHHIIHEFQQSPNQHKLLNPDLYPYVCICSQDIDAIRIKLARLTSDVEELHDQPSLSACLATINNLLISHTANLVSHESRIEGNETSCLTLFQGIIGHSSILATNTEKIEDNAADIGLLKTQLLQLMTHLGVPTAVALPAPAVPTVSFGASFPNTLPAVPASSASTATFPTLNLSGTSFPSFALRQSVAAGVSTAGCTGATQGLSNSEQSASADAGTSAGSSGQRPVRYSRRNAGQQVPTSHDSTPTAAAAAAGNTQTPAVAATTASTTANPFAAANTASPFTFSSGFSFGGGSVSTALPASTFLPGLGVPSVAALGAAVEVGLGLAAGAAVAAAGDVPAANIPALEGLHSHSLDAAYLADEVAEEDEEVAVAAAEEVVQVAALVQQRRWNWRGGMKAVSAVGAAVFVGWVMGKCKN